MNIKDKQGVIIMISKKISFLFIYYLFIWTIIHAEYSFQLDDLLPNNDNVYIGHLENGLTYYIKKNNEPQNIAELRLVLKVGSIHEDDHQQGLAHFTEHIAFSGSENFPGNSMTEYLTNIGFGFGSGRLNAMTSFETTSYMLSSKVDDHNMLDQAFLILSDWASRVTFDSDAIEKERGIILEEWRRGRGASERMWSNQKKVLFGDSKYAERMPIGKPEIIQNFDYQTLKDFYHDWYRPDLQAVIAVGDFAIEEIESLINKHFGSLPARENPRQLEEQLIQHHTGTVFAFHSDKEAINTVISIIYKHDPLKVITIRDYQKDLIISLFCNMLSHRFYEMSHQENPVFTSANAYYYSFIQPLDIFSLSAVVDENKIMEGFQGLITEIEKVKRYGFYLSELNLAKESMLKDAERAFMEKDKQLSNLLIGRYIYHFINNYPLLDEETIYVLIQTLLDSIQLDDLYSVLEELFGEDNRGVIITSPEKVELLFPSEEEILNLFSLVSSSDIKNIAENPHIGLLLPNHPPSKQIKKAKYDRKHDLYEWKLANGVIILLKETNFKNNEILYSVSRKGGLSQASDDILLSAKMSSLLVHNSGYGEYNRLQLDNYLSSKDLSFHITIGPNSENISGRSSVKDLKTIFELFWLNSNSLRFDETSFNSTLYRTEINLRNQQNSPLYYFRNEVNRILYNDHSRTKFIQVEDLQKINYHDAFSFYRDRFQSLNGFTFVFVGNITPHVLHDYIQTYLSPIINLHTNTEIIDHQIYFNQNHELKQIYRGEEDKASVNMILTSKYNYNFQENQSINALNYIFNELLREHIRERISGVYSISSSVRMEKEPLAQLSFTIDFDCSPDRVDELIDEVYSQLINLQEGFFSENMLENYKIVLRQKLAESSRSNHYYLSLIESLARYDNQRSIVFNPSKCMESISQDDLILLANKYFDLSNVKTIILYPSEYQMNN